MIKKFKKIRDLVKLLGNNRCKYCNTKLVNTILLCYENYLVEEGKRSLFD